MMVLSRKYIKYSVTCANLLIFYWQTYLKLNFFIVVFVRRHDLLDRGLQNKYPDHQEPEIPWHPEFPCWRY